jgi:hypothetical protein
MFNVGDNVEHIYTREVGRILSVNRDNNPMPSIDGRLIYDHSYRVQFNINIDNTREKYLMRPGEQPETVPMGNNGHGYEAWY